MSVDYNNIAKTFSQSRKNMKWEEIGYFLEILKPLPNTPLSGEGTRSLSILDVGCGNGRFYGALQETGLEISKYVGLDLSSGLLEEARNIYSGVDFEQGNMTQLEFLPFLKGSTAKQGGIFSHIFFIASFHHLENLDDRISSLKQAYKILEPGGTIYMTNWALDSDINSPKYSKDIISNSENTFGSQDYAIKFGEYDRYYHGFSLDELEYLFKETGFEVIENREFDTGKNIISIIKKPLR